MTARRRLSHLLLASHVGLVLLLAVLLLVTGAGIIHVTVRDQALAGTTQAAAEALDRLSEAAANLDVVSQLLVERPSLQASLRRNQRREAVAFLESFRDTASLDFVRVRSGGEVFAQSGGEPPDPDGSGLQFDPETGDPWLVGAASQTLGSGEIGVVTAVDLSVRAILASAASEVGFQLVSPASVVEGTPETPLALALRHVLATATAQSLSPGGDHGALRIEPVGGGAAGIAALLVAEIPAERVRRQTLEWLAAFATGSVLVAILAALLAIWLARRISRPFARLAVAAERLGVGDLETPVRAPASVLAESQALARSLESMRWQVRTLAAAERQQRAELEAVLDNVDEGIIAVDEARVVRYANRQMLRLLGADRAGVLGRFYGDVLRLAELPGQPPLDRRCAFLAARRQGAAQAVERCELAGGQRNLVIRAAAPNGDRQVAVLREESAEEAARSVRDAILANLSHEFQTPLAAQIASIELLREHLRGSEDAAARRLVNAQYRGALRLSHLVENLLESVRVESGEIVMRRKPLDLRAVVAEALDLMRPLIEQRDQQVKLSLPDGTRSLVGDPQRLQQVVVNLLANANKFAPDQSTLWIELSWQDDSAVLWVEDEGAGLPWPQPHDDLFAPFRRAPADEPSQRGTGLGLAIVRSVVERHGGRMRVAEPVHGRGARIGVVLPLEAVCVS